MNFYNSCTRENRNISRANKHDNVPKLLP